MKKALSFLLLAAVLGTVCAQAPQGFGYQAVVRDATGRVVADRQVTVRLSLLQGSADGTPRYAETHTATTDAAGLFTLTVGAGSPASGTFDNIDWGAGPWFLRSEVDPDGGSNFTLSTTQQLLSVPYALHAAQAGRSASDAALRTSLDSLALTIPTVPTQVSAFTNDAGYLTSYTERQVLSLSHDTLFLTGGSFVKLPAGFSGNYNDLANRPSIPTVPTNVSAFANDAGYLTSYTETQTLSQAAALGNSVNTQVKGVSDPTDPQDVVNLRTLDSALAALSRRLDSLASAVSQHASTPPSSTTARFVDLGLPSGLLWASCNLGATTPEGYGNYYAWGETSTKTTYSSDNYSFTDNPTTLPASSDAATALLGNGMRMPTMAEWGELENNTTSIWTTHNGVYGRQFIASNGNSIFLPAAGHISESSLIGLNDRGYYRSSSLYERDGEGYSYYFNSLDQYVSPTPYRAYGATIRAVCSSSTVPTCTTTYGDTTATAAGSFLWHGHTYTASGNYTGYYTNSVGCDSIVTLHLTITPVPVPAGWVDLGLPSGILWAECNIGATTPEGYGNYYAWAETATKTAYNDSNYRYYNIGIHITSITKYCRQHQGFNDGLTTLQPADDAATQALGSVARTPTQSEWEELIDNTTGEWTTVNGVNGWKFTATNGNSLFLPAAGLYDENVLFGVGVGGGYWSSSLSTTYDFHAVVFECTATIQQISDSPRHYGQSVRAVRYPGIP